ncbi:hypothetical protein HMN09_01037200 [Mycena chlorophos]|uniref:DASH complex subunit DAD2 n=1 Tax=Mycena chlorophos TaxID=658473 RepID=A0A8H6W052_MYCCL|nr:hypothetical protein HMN09_01037200 [Mycena chlorophos]
MSRQSVAANRASYAAGPSAANSAAANAKFLEKKKEFDAVSALHRASALYLQRIEGLAADVETMADAGQIHGEVLEQWPRMFQILNLFLASRDSSALGVDAEPSPAPELGERLVRIPLAALQGDVEETSRK